MMLPRLFLFFIWSVSFCLADLQTITIDGMSLSLKQPVFERFESGFAIFKLEGLLAKENMEYSGFIMISGAPRYEAPDKAMLYGAQITELSFNNLPRPTQDALRAKLGPMLAKKLAAPFACLLYPQPLSEQKPSGPAMPLLRIWPRIEIRTAEAVLVWVDGETRFVNIPGTDLQYIANTDWDLFFHRSSSKNFLRVETAWYEAYSMQGPWRPLQGSLPSDFLKIPKKHPRSGVLSSLGNVPRKTPLEIIVATEPTELVLFDGEPVWESLSQTEFSYAKNTVSDIFKAKDGFALLASGRWFGAHKLAGPWEALGHNAPKNLANIPANHIKTHVKASIPGTLEAESIKKYALEQQTITISRATAIPAKTNGNPQLVQTSDNLAVVKNTAWEMLQIADKYYVCVQGAWFVSSTSHGPWAVTPWLPPEIKSIPPSSPLYHLQSASVLSSTASSVTFAYRASYEGLFLDGPLVVFGTGYSEPGSLLDGAYYGLPATLGMAATIDLRSGSFFSPLKGPKACNAERQTLSFWGKKNYGCTIPITALPANAIVEQRASKR